MNSPLPARSVDHATFTPVEAIAPSIPIPANDHFEIPMTGQRHIAALVAAACVTLLVVAGFATLVIMAPGEARIRDATQPAAPAGVLPAEAETEGSVAPSSRERSGEVRQARAEASPPVTVMPELTETKSPPSALSRASARWASATVLGDARAEDLSDAAAEIDELAASVGEPMHETKGFAEERPVEMLEGEPSAEGAGTGEEMAEALTEPDPETTAAIARTDVVRTAHANRAVNLRAKPRDGSKVLLVVPYKARVGVIACDGWCEVEYDGTRGFVYKSFLK